MSLAAQIREWAEEAVSSALEEFGKRLASVDGEIKKLEARIQKLDEKEKTVLGRPASGRVLTDKPSSRVAPAKSPDK